MTGGAHHRQGKSKHKRPAAHKRPCRSAPATPSVSADFLKKDFIHHRHEWTARASWSDVTVDVAGRPISVEEYEIQLRATDASGNPVETELQADSAQIRGSAFTVATGTAPVNGNARELDNTGDLIKATLTSLTAGIQAQVDFFARAKDTHTPSLRVSVFNVTDSAEVAHRDFSPSKTKKAQLGGSIQFTPVSGKTYEARATWLSGSSSTGLLDAVQWHDMGNAAVWTAHVKATAANHALFHPLPHPDAWFYQVRARVLNRIHGGACWSAWSSWTSATQPVSTDPTGPDAPTGITLTMRKDAPAGNPWRARLVWNEVPHWIPPDGDPVEGARRYAIQFQAFKDSSSTNPLHTHSVTVEADPSSTTNEHSFLGIRGRRYYRARIKSIGFDGVPGAWSSYTSKVTPHGDPDDPQNIAVMNPSPRVVRVTWDPPADETDVDRYKVELRRSGTVVETTYVARGTHQFKWAIPDAEYAAHAHATYRARVSSVEEPYSTDPDDVGPAGSDTANESSQIESVDVADSVVLDATQVDISAIAAAIGTPSDGSAPSSSPTPTVQGGVGFLAVKWTAISNADPVTYDVHVSTTTGFTPSGGTLAGSISGTLFFIRAMPDASALTYGTTYYVKLVARDVDGSAAAGSQGSGTLVQINTPDVAASSITANEILAASITADRFAATLILSSLFATSDPALGGARVEFDGTGIRCYASDGTLLVNIPTTGGAVYVNADLLASSLTVVGDAVFLSNGNVLDRGSALTLNAKVADPGAAPTVTELDTFVTLGTLTAGVGLCYDPAGDSGGATPTYWTAGSGTSTELKNVYEFNASTGALLRSIDISAGLGLGTPRVWGVARVGSFIAVLAESTGASLYKILTYNQSTLAFVASIDVTAKVLNLQPGLFYDATLSRIVVVSTVSSTAGSRLRLAKFSQSAGVLTFDANLDLDSGVTCTPGSTILPSGVRVTESDINSGSAVYWIAIAAGTTLTPAAVYAFDVSTGSLVTQQHFIAYGGAPYGITHDGTRFQSIGNSARGKVLRHSNVKFSSTNAYGGFFVGYTWYDSNATGGTHQSAVSPRRSVNIYKRRIYLVTTPNIPSGAGGTDDPNSEHVFVKLAGSDPGATLSSYFQQGGDLTVTSNSFDTYDTSTAGSSGTAFPSGTPAVIQSANGAWELGGDGSVILPTHGARAFRTSTQTITTSTWTAVTLTASEDFDDDTFHDLSTNPSRFTVPSTGLYMVTWNVGWTGNATGRRAVGVTVNGAATPDNDKNMTIPASVATAIRPMVTVLVRLTAGDYVEGRVFQDSGSGLTVTDAALTIEQLKRTA